MSISEERNNADQAASAEQVLTLCGGSTPIGTNKRRCLLWYALSSLAAGICIIVVGILDQSPLLAAAGASVCVGSVLLRWWVHVRSMPREIRWTIRDSCLEISEARGHAEALKWPEVHSVGPIVSDSAGSSMTVVAAVGRRKRKASIFLPTGKADFGGARSMTRMLNLTSIFVLPDRRRGAPQITRSRIHCRTHMTARCGPRLDRVLSHLRFPQSASQVWLEWWVRCC